MNHMLGKLLGFYTLRCGGGEGGGGDGTGDSNAFGGAPAEADQAGTTGATASAEVTGDAAPAPAEAAPAPAPAEAAPAPAPAELAPTSFPDQMVGGSGIIGGAMGAPLSPLEPVNIDPNAGKVTTAIVGNTPAFSINGTPSKAIDFVAPTTGSMVTKATGSKTAGSLFDIATAPITGPYNAAAGLINLGIGAVNEFATKSEPKSGDFVTTDTYADGKTGAPVEGPDRGSNFVGGEGGMGGDLPATGIIGSAMAAPVASVAPAPAASGEVNGNLFGNLTMGGWSRASKRFSARKSKPGVPA